jgi:polysaccharide export outer membrane protein
MKELKAFTPTADRPPAKSVISRLLAGSMGVEIRRPLLATAATAPLLLVAACSDILPGLNLHIEHKTEHPWHVVAKGNGHYQAVSGDNLLRYQVVTITPDVMLAMARIAADRKLPQADTLKRLPFVDAAPEYKIGAGDVLNVTVWEHPELTAPAGVSGGGQSQSGSSIPDGRLVAANGTIFYPYCGTFSVANLTAAQVRDMIRDKLSRVLKDPQVDVRIVAYRARRILVTGEVSKQGIVTMNDGPMPLLEAISTAGELSSTASRRQAVLIRNGVSYPIDLAGLLSGSPGAVDPGLEPGDELHIPDQSADQVFMLGAVSTQKPVIMQQNSMTLVEALTQAGGLDSARARDSGVFIFRMPRGGEPTPEATIFALNLGRPEGLLMASSFPLQPRDIVYVQATGFSQYNTIVNQFLPTVTTIFDLFELHNLTK